MVKLQRTRQCSQELPTDIHSWQGSLTFIIKQQTLWNVGDGHETVVRIAGTQSRQDAAVSREQLPRSKKDYCSLVIDRRISTVRREARTATSSSGWPSLMAADSMSAAVATAQQSAPPTVCPQRQST